MSRKTLIACVVAYATLVSFGPASAAEGATLIELTQTPCQFVEAEGTDHGYRAASADDCKAINASTGAARLQASPPLSLKPGKYIFRVMNKNVPYTLGFWLRGDGLVNRARLPGVSGAGLQTGTSKDYEIELKPGEYVYSCPLNPTPDYKIIVAE